MNRKSIFQLSGLIISTFLWPCRYTCLIASSRRKAARGLSFWCTILPKCVAKSVPYCTETYFVGICILYDKPFKPIWVTRYDPETEIWSWDREQQSNRTNSGSYPIKDFSANKNCVKSMLPKWESRLREAEIFMPSYCFTMIEPRRINPTLQVLL